MEEKVLKGITILSLIMTAVVCISMYFFPDMHEKAVLAAEAEAKLMEHGEVTVVTKNEKPEEIVEDLEVTNAQLKIELPDGLDMSDVEIRNDYISQTVYIRLDTEVEDYFSEYRISGKCNHIASLSYYTNSEGGIIALGLDKVYEIDDKYEDGNLYLDFMSPHEIYDKVIVVDAGHGGRAAGAVKMQVQEKDIDLDIVLELKRLLDADDKNIGVYYTRLDDANPTLDQRVQLANKADADLFISVHNNSTHSGNFSDLKGTQVLYSESDTSEYSSKRLASIMLGSVCDSVKSRKIGLLAADDIYIIRTSEVPVSLVEVGFMTNRDELEKLQDKDYQKKAAQGIYNGMMKAFTEGY